VGTIGLFLSQDVRQVIGVDVVPEAIADAQRNAIDNGITNTCFVVGDATQIVSQLPAPDVIVLDPPRAGLSESIITTIAAQKPRRVVYVSCNPVTLVRDLVRFKDLGYVPERIQPVDMFAQTTHLEVVVALACSVKPSSPSPR
jgi:23S rRNA (uracil1939-C5)-methyltransferase